jgi:CRISPR system Cascade subunit CasA
MMANFSFNLVDQPWIPCTDLNGRSRTLSLSELMMRAHELIAIHCQNPLTEAAMLRVLLAAIHRAVDGPRTSSDWKALYKTGKFDDRIPQYLNNWKSRFDLFSPENPFYQTAGLQVIDKNENPSPLSVVNIIMGRSSGNNKTLFDHTTDDTRVQVSPAEAANILLTAQMFSLQGLNRKTTNLFGYQQSFLNSVLVNGILIALSGKSLFETLMLNLLVYSDNQPIPNTPADCPVWERADRGETKAVIPKGYLD